MVVIGEIDVIAQQGHASPEEEAIDGPSEGVSILSYVYLQIRSKGYSSSAYSLSSSFFFFSSLRVEKRGNGRCWVVLRRSCWVSLRIMVMINNMVVPN